MRARFRFARRGSFTLIEILIVIALIAVLAGLLMPAITAVRRAARNAEAKEQMLQLLTAIRGYNADYGKVPLLEQGEDRGFSAGYDKKSEDYDQAELMNVLRATGAGWDSVGEGNLNPKRIVFFEPRMAKDPAQPRSGLGADGRLYDPWGHPYLIKIDGNGDGFISLDYTDVTQAEGMVIAISEGPDTTLGNKKKKHKRLKEADDILAR